MHELSFIAAFVELLAPRRCAGCNRMMRFEQRGAFCAACAPLLELAPPAHRPPGHSAAAFVYGGPLADAIVRLKYSRRSELAPMLGALLAEAALPYAGRVARVVPLPLHRARLRARGFNQSALLARPVARALGVPLDARALRRVRATADQARLPRASRAENVRAAFAVARDVHGARMLLIDDVRTTGATLAEAAAALSEAGAAEVYTLALARAEA